MKRGRKKGTKNRYKISKGAFPNKKHGTGSVFNKETVERQLRGL